VNNLPNGTVLVPARLSDVPLIHRMIQDAIRETPLYSDEFKVFESRRFNRAFLRTLIDADPAYAFFVKDESGENAGFMLSGPEYGVLFLYWSYLIPRFRRGTLAMRSMRDFVAYWDNGRFHKIVAFVRPDNRSPRLLMRRNKYTESVLLKQQLFGQDYIMCERMLNKVVEGYDQGLSYGVGKRLRLKVKSMLTASRTSS
jgi:RimJ/RimL family protein N-acetyltransferase